MKTETHTIAFQKKALAGILLLQLSFAITAGAQNIINVSNPNLNVNDNNELSLINNTHPNIGNIRIPSGPNGLGAIGPNIGNPPKVINLVQAVITNPPPKQQVAVTSRPIVTQAPAQRRVNPVTRINKPKIVAGNYKPKPVVPKTSSVARRPTPVVKPASRVIASAAKPKPVTPKPVVVKPVQLENNPVIAMVQAPVVFEEKTDNSEATSVQAFTPGNSVMANIPLQLNTNNAPIVRTPESFASSKSESSGLSKKSAHASHKSKHKSMKHLRYATNKKLMKLFAKNRKHKIDPVRCFVWK